MAAAAARGVPLIAFAREVPFVEITEAVHARIIDALLIERAATTLALGHLLTRQAESLERQAHRTLISAIIEPGDDHPAGTAEAEARARAMGVPVTGRQLVAVVVRIPDAVSPAAAAARLACLRLAVSRCSRSRRPWPPPAGTPASPRWSAPWTTCGRGRCCRCLRPRTPTRSSRRSRAGC